MAKVKILLTYNLCDDEDFDGEFNFDSIDGEYVGERIGQESANEIMNSLEEFDNKEAVVQLIGDAGTILKEKKIKIY